MKSYLEFKKEFGFRKGQKAALAYAMYLLYSKDND